MNPHETLLTVSAIIAGSLVSEDAAAISVGLLIRAERLDWITGLTGAFLGIFCGDAMVWLLGRLAARGAERYAFARRWLHDPRTAAFAAWLDRDGWQALFAARCLPFARVPLCFAAGACGRNGGRFLIWTALAAALWTPIIVGAAALVGSVGPLWQSLPLVVAIVLVWRLATHKSDAFLRARWFARISRLWRWEFWPTWIFYLPLAPYFLWLAIRYRSATVWTCANPALPHGGVVGESKHEILAQLPSPWTLPHRLIPAAPIGDRLAAVQTAIESGGFALPLILKPDVGERGAGVRLVRTCDDVERVLEACPFDLVLQVYHPGPFEAGVYYVRHPDEPTGRIFSITDKRFPEVVGDGRASLEALVWNHARYRMQARRFLARYPDAATRIPAAGEVVRLAIAGNHCQGTLFLDGRDLITPALTRRFDEIARSFDGFCIGRFDVRYADRERFRAGEDLAIVELNGVLSESTNIYDPSHSLLFAYRTLARQWERLFEIGHAWRRRGIQPSSLMELARLVWQHQRGLRPSSLAD